ncbi:MAG: NAD(P)H-quinone oxidoreductase [Cryobacterium sp.]|nr:NAD(P)H-quinone oxidoreductase [Oligoflexia bacterium]
MKYVAHTPGGPESLKIATGPKPARADGEMIIEVFAAGVNRPDISQRQGTYPPPPGASPVLGLEVAGLVHAVGPDSRFRIGDRVCALAPGGGYAEYCVVPEGSCLPIPEGLTFEEAAGIPENYFTVWANVFQIGELKAGEKFLVHGGSSGIGTTAIQLARAFGAEVYTTAGSAEKCAKCVEIGADQALNYREKDFENEWKDLNLILDMVGGKYTRKNIHCLGMRGRLVQIAALQGGEVTFDIFKIMQKRITLTGSTLRPRSVAEKAQIAQELSAKVWPLFREKKLKVLIDRIYPIEEAAEAHKRMESSQHIGKIILQVKK